MQIRKMMISDYEEMVQLWLNTPGMGLRTVDDSKESIARFLDRNPDTNFAAIEDGKIVGTIMCGHDGRRGYLYHMAVDRSAQRQGTGSELVSAVVDSLTKLGINRAALVVYRSNEAGNIFWDKMDFKEREDLVYRNRSLNPDNY